MSQASVQNGTEKKRHTEMSTFFGLLVFDAQTRACFSYAERLFTAVSE